MSNIGQSEEKIIVVTGGTKGIGYETASGLAAQGGSVIIIGRDPQRGSEAVTSMRQNTGNQAISFLQADLSSLTDIRRLAEQLIREYPHIHVLVNNAGGANKERIVTADGMEATFVTNHLAPFLLTNLLLPALKASTPARIVNVNSIQHRSGRIDFADLQSERDYDMMRVYQQAKLATLLFTYELARRLQGSGVTVNAADPGGTLQAAKAIPLPLTMRLILPLLAPFLTPRNAARSSIYLASSTDAAGLTGQYVNFRKKVVRSSAASYDQATAQKLWDISAELVGLRAEVLNF